MVVAYVAIQTLSTEYSTFVPYPPVIKPMVNERTQKKVKIVAGGRETLECLKEFVDLANIPKRYGGELRCVRGQEKTVPRSDGWSIESCRCFSQCQYHAQ